MDKYEQLSKYFEEMININNDGYNTFLFKIFRI